MPNADTIIAVEGLSKRYFVGHMDARTEAYDSLRDTIARHARNLRRKTLDMVRGAPMVEGDTVEDFWALNNVSFDVRRGEVVGIIGRNGAGKSTLLKILSRITEPTEGRVRIRGRVASLLEVGTGFHPELTGRENIFLNGAILGMTRQEIKARFDEIVAFAEVERFLDTPVKRYSSGMYVRLAFAVAAHLNPEILLVDEVLSVGDAEFQQKCLGKMDGVARDGRTVLFVSHDIRKMIALCNRGILLNSGRLEAEGEMPAVAERYMSHRLKTDGFADLARRADRTGSGEARFQSVELLAQGERSRTFAFGRPFSQKIRVNVKKELGRGLIGTTIRSSDGTPIFCLMNVDDRCHWSADVDDHEFTITIERLVLYPGTYSIDLWMGDRNEYRVDYVTDAISFTVVQEPHSLVERTLEGSNGIVYQSAVWRHRKAAESALPAACEPELDLLTHSPL